MQTATNLLQTTTDLWFSLIYHSSVLYCTQSSLIYHNPCVIKHRLHIIVDWPCSIGDWQQTDFITCSSLDCPPLWRQQLTASRRRPGPRLQSDCDKHDCEFIAVTAFYGFPLLVTVAWKSCIKFSDSHSTRHHSALFNWALTVWESSD